MELLRLSYQNELDHVVTRTEATTDVVGVIFHEAHWGTIINDLSWEQQAVNREAHLRRVYRDKWLFVAIAKAALASVGEGKTTVVIFLTERMRTAFRDRP